MTAITFKDLNIFSTYRVYFEFILHTHLVEAIVCSKCFHAMRFLCRSGVSLSSVNTNILGLFGRMGACEYIVHAALQFLLFDNNIEAQNVILQACVVIRNLALDDDNCIALGELGACDLMIRIIQTFSEHANIMDEVYLKHTYLVL